MAAMVRYNEPHATSRPSTLLPSDQVSHKRRKLSDSRWASSLMEQAGGDNVFKARIAGPAACPNCATHSGSFGPTLQPLALQETPNFSFASYLADDEEDEEEGGVRLDQEDHARGSSTSAIASTSQANSIDIARPNDQPADTPRVDSPFSHGEESQYLQLPFPVLPDPRGASSLRASESSAPNFPLFLADNFDNHSFEPLHTVSDEGDPTDDTAVPQGPEELMPVGFFPPGPGMPPLFEGSTDGPFTVYTFLAEDALPVDDPLRNYDFTEFVSNWRLRSGLDKDLPAYGSCIEPDLDLLKPTGTIRGYKKGLLSADVQGIRWQELGLSRDDAVSARKILHPSNLNLACEIDHSLQYASSSVETSDRKYDFSTFAPKHDPFINHYQLRNNLAATSRNDIFYVAENSIVRASLACPESLDIVTGPSRGFADWKVSCLAASPAGASPHDLVIAGGVNGEYALLGAGRDDRPIRAEGHIVQAEDGLITHAHLFADRRSGLPQAAFASNDLHLRVLDVATQRVVAAHRYGPDNAINCAATAPDGRLRALSGDDCAVLVTAVDGGAVLQELRCHTDANFACAWSHDGRFLATASQDCTVAVWDARVWSRPVQVLDKVMSCARSLHFTDRGELVIAENDDVVSICAPGTFARRQTLDFFGAIAGVALLDGGRELVVANADRTVGGLLSYSRIDSHASYSMAARPSSHRRREYRNLDLELAFL